MMALVVIVAFMTSVLYQNVHGLKDLEVCIKNGLCVCVCVARGDFPLQFVYRVALPLFPLIESINMIFNYIQPINQLAIG